MADESKTRQLTITDQKDDVIHHLNEYRRSNHLCDVTIVAGGREFPAHRAVLAAGDGFFNGLFAANMRERSENRIELLQVDPDVVDDVLGYIYTGEIKLTQENAQLVAIASDFLLLDKLKAKVDEFLAHVVFKDIPLSDLMSVYYFANRYKCNLLEKAMLQMIQRNFETFVTKLHEEFLELSADALEEIIASSDLVVTSEEVVFRAVVDWVQYKEERRDSFYKLFGHIRMCSLSKEFIQSCVTKEDFVSTNPDCLELLRQHMDTPYVATFTNIQHPRHCLDLYTDAVLVCPRQNHGTHVMEIYFYIPSDNSWYKYHNIPYRGVGDISCGLYYQSKVFILTYNYDDVTVDMHDLETNTSSPSVASFGVGSLCGFGATCLHAAIYVIGGSQLIDEDSDSEDSEPVSDAFACDISTVCGTQSTTCSVRHIASLNTPREYPLVVNDGKYIYALGGSVSEEDKTNTVERYDPCSDSWKYLSPMNSYRCAKFGPLESQCVVANGKIFVIQEIKVEEFDLVYEIEMNIWSRISQAPMGAPICGPLKTIAFCEKNLYCIYWKKGADKSLERPSKVNLITHDVKNQTWDVTLCLDLETRKYMDTVLDTRQGKWWRCLLNGVVVRLRKDMVATLGGPLSQDSHKVGMML